MYKYYIFILSCRTYLYYTKICSCDPRYPIIFLVVLVIDVCRICQRGASQTFLVHYSFFEKIYLLLSYATSVCLSVRPSVFPSVRLSSVEIISFRGILISNRTIDLKISLNVRKGVVHVRKA